jgi:hypothetical protein
MENEGGFWSVNKEIDTYTGPSAALFCDLDRDALPDVIWGASGGDEIFWTQTSAGSFRLTSTKSVVSSINQGDSAKIGILHFYHKGREGDLAERLKSLQVSIRKGGTTPYTDADVAKVFHYFHLYLDDGDGIYDPALDPLAATAISIQPEGTPGIYNIVFDDEPNLDVQPNQMGNFFIVVQLRPDAGEGTGPDDFQAKIGETGNGARDAMNTYDLPEIPGAHAWSSIITITDNPPPTPTPTPVPTATPTATPTAVPTPTPEAQPDGWLLE